MHPRIAHWIWLHQDKLPTLTYQTRQTLHLVGSFVLFFAVAMALIALDAKDHRQRVAQAHSVLGQSDMRFTSILPCAACAAQDIHTQCSY